MGKKKSGRLATQSLLLHGVNRLGRVASFQKKGRFNAVKLGAKGKKEEKKVVPISTKEARWYAADDVKKPLASRKANHKPTRLRKSITPGTVLILLAGRFRGKRVVFLKALESGLLLVTGPYKINGVPLRRVNQAYVIATSTRVDVSGVNTKQINDAFFARAKKDKSSKDAEFFTEESKKAERPAEKKKAQVAVDTPVLKAIKDVEFLKHYLNAKFSLTKGQKPHELKF